MIYPITRFITATILLIVSGAAFAHTGHTVSGWSAGWTHPFSGLDHLLAMLAVGLWAAQGGGRRIWLLPAAFMTAMVAGAGVTMMLQYVLPVLETGIVLSLLALGLLIALSLRLPVPAGMAIAALFGVFHGYAHGMELPTSAAPLTYVMGFLLATAALHLGGITAGVLMRERYTVLAKISGGAIALSGIGLLAFTV